MSLKKKSINGSFVTPRMEKNKKRGLGFSGFALCLFSFKQKIWFVAFCQYPKRHRISLTLKKTKTKKKVKF